MEEFSRAGDAGEATEQTAQRVLQAYRERRRRRRADDTYFGALDCLLPRAEAGLAESERARRREEILEEADAAGMPRDLAERLYEVALEEGLDPALGFELVRCGLGVAPPPEGLSNAPQQPMVDRYLPEWMFPPVPPDELLRERMLRLSFRRLRALLEQHDDVDEAFRAFAREPDVGHFGY